MLLPFWKMHGAGNDFVMVDGISRPFTLSAGQIRLVCDRRFGVGCDQLLVVEPAAVPGVDFKYRIFNQDGGEVQMCGNGARCFAVFVRALGLTDKRLIRCETAAGVISPEVLADGTVRVAMGAPRLSPEEIPFVADGMSAISRGDDRLYQVHASGSSHWLSIVSMGNPHAVKVVGDAESADVEELGRALQDHPAFPERVNVGFLEVRDSSHARLRVFERGVGETLACGTGACAAAVAGIRRGLLSSPVEMEMKGGTLVIEWGGVHAGKPSCVYLSGPAQIVFRGEIEIAP